MNQTADQPPFTLGWIYTAEDINLVRKHICSLTQLFNLQESFTRKCEDVAYRCREGPLPDELVKGRLLTREDLDYILDDYYQLREARTSKVCQL